VGCQTLVHNDPKTHVAQGTYTNSAHVLVRAPVFAL
jgi:hypothetical protein